MATVSTSADTGDDLAQESASAGHTASPPVNLLWTGGWDSSFQLLQLLLLHRREVVPHYLVDPTRPSTRAELAAMERIRTRLFEEYPHTRGLLGPVQKFDVADLAPDPGITAAFGRIVAETFMGSQYEWLARFCKQRGIARLELGAGHRGGRIQKVIGPLVTQTDEDGYPSYRIGEAYRDTKEFTVFGGFSFPLFALSKLETAEVAAERGWRGVLELTCFCHKPRHGTEPCGCCNPCLYAVDEGFGWRIPRKNRIKGVFYRALIRPMKPPVKAVLRQLGMRRANPKEPVRR
ncbi:hypothetical protein [Luteimonas suaedae]|uniref:hypothetical protein n=1 Tax=Luteimonas suaedae TaxID=2605430 RepID=UPI0011EFF251|nr:hypothetical protein [Luteimonas suaedae]